MTLRDLVKRPPLGATPVDAGRWCFQVWAPHPQALQLELDGQHHRVERDAWGYGRLELPAAAGQPYAWILDGQARPDPASRAQAAGVHGPSTLVTGRRQWRCDSWPDPALGEHVIYELHVGTFSPAGTFAGVIERLPQLAELGITALELMPIAEFPGHRNWGYDGVLPYAAEASYGGVEGLCELVDAAHQQGLCVFLDVVYNHLGPEGNYLREFGPYFTDAYATPWGDALNFSEADSDHVRRYFIENALYWLLDCRIDGLRLDAVHAIVDPSPLPFLEALAAAVDVAREMTGRRLHLVAESAANDARLVLPRESGGVGLSATWSDDFHHALHVALTGETDGYYVDYGAPDSLARVLRDGFAYTGQYSSYRRRGHGRNTAGMSSDQFVIAAQNHDQVGNRARAERLAELVDFDRLKLAAAALLLTPYVPLLFMGEEYGETAPFHYFIDHGDPGLVEAVREGRREELGAFAWEGELPDPASPASFDASRLDWSLRERDRHCRLLAWYRTLIEVRTRPWFNRDHRRQQVDQTGTAIVCRAPGMQLLLNFGPDPVTVAAHGRRVLDSADRRWGGAGEVAPETVDGSAPLPPWGVILLRNEGS